jgi:serine/threonine protein kinase
MTDRTRANFIFKQIVLGVDEIHKEGFIHRDLKPANIAINDDSLEISIIDFETGNSSMTCNFSFLILG